MSSHLARLFVAVLPLLVGCNLGGSRSDRTTFADGPPESRPSRFAERRTRRDDERRTLEELLARAHEAAGKQRYDVALSLYRQVVASDPDNAAAHHGLAIIADGEQDHRGAEEHYRLALRGQPRNPDLLNDVGYSFLMQKRYSEAERFLRRAVDVDPRHVLATSNLGHTVAQQGRMEEALELFRRVGTESQAQAEIAKYTGNPRDPFAREPEPARRPEPGIGDGEWAELSPAEMRELMERARLDAIADRRERDHVDVNAIRALDRGEFRDSGAAARGDQPIAWDPSERWPGGETARAPEPARDDVLRPAPLENPRSTDPTLVRFDDPPGGTPGRRDNEVAPPRDERAVSADPIRSAAANPNDLWPARVDAFDTPPRGAGANGITQVGFDDGTNPWPAHDSAPDPRAATTPREDWGHERRMTPAAGPPFDPNAARRRAAMLGLGAGAGMPLTIEPRTTPPGRGLSPLNGGGGRPANGPASAPVEEWGIDDWPASGNEAAAVEPIPTTAPVASHPSLYRSADGTVHAAAHGVARPPYSDTASDTIRRQREEIDRQRAALDRMTAERRAMNGQLEADRRAFQGGGAPHPGFPADFGPVTRTPRPRGETDHDANW